MPLPLTAYQTVKQLADAGLSFRQIQARTGISRGTVSNMINGRWSEDRAGTPALLEVQEVPRWRCGECGALNVVSVCLTCIARRRQIKTP